MGKRPRKEEGAEGGKRGACNKDHGKEDMKRMHIFNKSIKKPYAQRRASRGGNNV